MLKEQTILLSKIAVERTRVEICFVAISAAILVYKFKILRGYSANGSTAEW